MKYAIIRSGGKQYRCAVGDAIEVDRLPLEAGAAHTFGEVLLVADGDNISVGTPSVANMLVKGTVVDHVKGPKLIAFRYKPKERQRRKRGHRQQYTRVRIDAIGSDDEDKQES
jgi:large subunit ribosomal protein L21